MKKAILFSTLILVLFSLILCFFAYIGGKQEAHRMKREIFSYILENQFVLERPESFQEFPYTVTGFADAGVEYGYYYSPDGSYRFAGQPYRDGYLQYGRPNHGEDWYYHERICENWFYYEKHFG